MELLRNRGRALLLIAIAAAVASGGPRSLRADAPPSEYEVKAAFLYNFLSFVEWPEASLPEDRFTIAIVGRDPFGSVLDDVVANERHAGRPLVVRRVMRARDAADAQVAFLALPDSQLDGALADLAARPVLTVGEARDFAKRGGVIQLRVQDGRVKFEVNSGAAAAGGLKVSSHLLKLALVVHEREAPGGSGTSRERP